MKEFRAKNRRKTTGGVLYSYDEERMMAETFSALLSDLSETGACISRKRRSRRAATSISIEED